MSWKQKIEKSREVWREAQERFGLENIGIGFTGKKDSSVMVHILKQLVEEEGWQMPTLFFIDHGAHFDEVLEHLERLEEEWDIRVERIKDERLIEKFNNEKDDYKKRKILWGTKIALLDKVRKDNKWKAVASSIRKSESKAREDESFISEREGHFRVHPMLEWEESDVWGYIKENDLIYNPLYDEGYRSIGEKEFTSKVGEDGEEREGRDQVKEEVMAELRSMGYF